MYANLFYISSANKDKPRTKFAMSSMRRKAGNTTKTETTKEVAARYFERYVIADSFYVKNYDMFNRNKIPPARVTDLVVVNSTKVSNSSVAVQLSWTSVGDDYSINQGNSWNPLYIVLAYEDFQ